MKTKLALSAALLALTATLRAAPLTATAAVHTQPSETSPAFTVLKAGTDPVPAANTIATTPAGWMAVEVPGPFEGYVLNRDILKSLDVSPGAAIHTAPKATSPVLATMEAGDKATITGLEGKWTQIRLEKTITGYIQTGGSSSYVPPAPVAPAPAASAPAATTSAAPAPMAPAPVSPVAYGSSGAGQPVPVVNLSDSGSSALPRQFQGRFVSTRSHFRPRRPYDWALNDEAGVRYAYVDISKLLLTEQIEKYIDHVVVVFGAAKATADGKDIVIAVESLQLR